MPTFTYVARDTQGQLVSGTLAADTQQQVLRSLDEQALFPVEVREGGEARRALGGRRKVNIKHVAVLYSQFADLLRAGVPVLRALDVLHRQNSRPVLKEILREVREDLSGGQTLADAMEKHPNAFNPLHVSMIRAGEKGGFLEDVLSRIAVFTERQNELRGKLIGSMIYPCVLIGAGSIIVIFLLTNVVPRIRSFLKGDLPLLTQILFAVCDFLAEHGSWVLGGFVAAVLLAVFACRSGRGRLVWDRLQFKVPLLGEIIKLVGICRFCRILGTLLHNGVPILQALKIARDSAGNRLLIDAVDQAIEAVRKGASLAAPLGKGNLFPLDIVDMIAVGEESNNLENVLVTIADSYEARTARKIDFMVRILEPMLLILLAMVIACIAIALLLPIMSISSRAA